MALARQGLADCRARLGDDWTSALGVFVKGDETISVSFTVPHRPVFRWRKGADGDLLFLDLDTLLLHRRQALGLANKRTREEEEEEEDEEEEEEEEEEDEAEAEALRLSPTSPPITPWLDPDYDAGR
jgi:hypothetical protein